MTQAKAVLLSIFCFFFTVTCYGKVSTALSSSTIPWGRPFQFTIYTDTKAEPDIAPLKKNFRIAGKASGQRLSYVNGKRTQSYQYSYTLVPRMEGDKLPEKTQRVIIPAIQVGQERTDPASVKLQPPVSEIKEGTQTKLAIRSKVEPETPYVQQMAIVTIEVVIDEDISERVQSMSLTPVSIPDSRVVTLGEPSLSRQYLANQPVTVITKRLAIFPQSSGTLTIPPITFTAEVVNKRRSSGQNPRRHPFSTLRHYTRPLQVISKPHSLTVKKIPQSVSGEWLPAASLTATENYRPDKSTYRVGDIIERRIVLKAANLIGAQLPSLKKPQVNGANVYKNPPDIKNSSQKGFPSGKRVEIFRFIPTEPGTMKIPPVTVNWFDTDKQQMKQLKLPGKTYHIMPAEGAISTGKTTSRQPPQAGPPGDSTSPSATDSTAQAQKTAPARYPYGYIIAAVLLFPGLAGLLWWLLRRYRRRSGKHQQTATTSQTGNHGHGYRRALKHFKKACQREQTKTVYKNWRQLLQATACYTGLTSEQVCASLSPASHEALAEVTGALYGRNRNQAIDGNRLYQNIAADLQALIEQQNPSEKRALNALYPH